jgi:hypothetical protein
MRNRKKERMKEKKKERKKERKKEIKKERKKERKKAINNDLLSPPQLSSARLYTITTVESSDEARY